MIRSVVVTESMRENIYLALSRSGLSQKDFTRIAKLNQGWVSTVMSGKRKRVAPKMLEKIKEGLAQIDVNLDLSSNSQVSELVVGQAHKAAVNLFTWLLDDCSKPLEEVGKIAQFLAANVSVAQKIQQANKNQLFDAGVYEVSFRGHKGIMEVSVQESSFSSNTCSVSQRLFFSFEGIEDPKVLGYMDEIFVVKRIENSA